MKVLSERTEETGDCRRAINGSRTGGIQLPETLKGKGERMESEGQKE
jgi:hypothetical protein